MGEHDWFNYRGLICCRICGIVKRMDGVNKACKGPIVVTTRASATAPTIRATAMSIPGEDHWPTMPQEDSTDD